MIKKVLQHADGSVSFTIGFSNLEVSGNPIIKEFDLSNLDDKFFNNIIDNPTNFDVMIKNGVATIRAKKQFNVIQSKKGAQNVNKISI